MVKYPYRQFECTKYDDCLFERAKQNRHSFTCHGCKKATFASEIVLARALKNVPAPEVKAQPAKVHVKQCRYCGHVVEAESVFNVCSSTICQAKEVRNVARRSALAKDAAGPIEWRQCLVCDQPFSITKYQRRKLRCGPCEHKYRAAYIKVYHEEEKANIPICRT